MKPMARPMYCNRMVYLLRSFHCCGSPRNAQQKANKNPYTNTILLPKTSFPLRANAATREHAFRDRCTSDLYPWQLKNNPKDHFILHDGPPYANGDVHMGHALNKILKDIVNRYKTLQGYRVWYRPGWDCHGLPIELKALEALRSSNEHLSPTDIRRIAKEKALFELDNQRTNFKSWGVMGDWDHPYKTLDPDYEVRQLQVFSDMVKKGYIYRQLKPVYWSPSSRSALAESELEYKDDHESRSIYVRFPIERFNGELAERWAPLKDRSIYALVWTTTPWTIPSNKAISIHSLLRYSLVSIKATNTAPALYLIGSDRLGAIQSLLGSDCSMELIDEVYGYDLLGAQYKHPLGNESLPIILGDHVTAASGTSLVHTAPGHGLEDYEVCKKLGIEPFSPVDDHGKFTLDAGPQLQGKFAFDEGNETIISMLEDADALVTEQVYRHKYPYDWRTKKPIMLRATSQWFINVEDLQKDAVEALKTVQMIPNVSLHRLEQFTLSRKEWCISRQRSWGVPIPALYDTETGDALLTETSLEHIMAVLQERGTDAWWEEPNDDVFVAPAYRNNGKTYKRGYDTMDVWFDSGTSWTMIRDIVQREPLADVYLEGSDQHRGWFQSSLLTSIASTQKVPYGTLVTHGFVLDEQGIKMSKSIGNVIKPSLITHGGEDKKKNPAYGTDVLRLWVAQCDYTHDVVIGPTVIAQVAESIRKIRTTARFLLGNLNDFSHNDCVAYEALSEMDRYMLHELYQFNTSVTDAYEEYAFNRVMQTVQRFTTQQLSSFYFDIIKDRLYNEPAASSTRRMTQTVLYHIVQAYAKALAPVACHTAEEMYECYRDLTPRAESSLFKTGWLEKDETWYQPGLAERWEILKDVRTQVNQVLEQARQQKVVNSSQEAEIDLVIDETTPIGQYLMNSSQVLDLSSLFLTSTVRVHPHNSNVSGPFVHKCHIGPEHTECTIISRRSELHKCPRCWQYISTNDATLCHRCHTVCSV